MQVYFEEIRMVVELMQVYLAMVSEVLLACTEIGAGIVWEPLACLHANAHFVNGCIARFVNGCIVRYPVHG